jgi:hypothetical protein
MYWPVISSHPEKMVEAYSRITTNRMMDGVQAYEERLVMEARESEMEASVAGTPEPMELAI